MNLGSQILKNPVMPKKVPRFFSVLEAPRPNIAHFLSGDNFLPPGFIIYPTYLLLWDLFFFFLLFLGDPVALGPREVRDVSGILIWGLNWWDYILICHLRTKEWPLLVDIFPLALFLGPRRTSVGCPQIPASILSIVAFSQLGASSFKGKQILKWEMNRDAKAGILEVKHSTPFGISGNLD